MSGRMRTFGDPRRSIQRRGTQPLPAGSPAQAPALRRRDRGFRAVLPVLPRENQRPNTH